MKPLTEKERLILKKLGKKPRTANEIIASVFRNDLRKGPSYVLNTRGWRFYVHLNKLFAPLERKGLIIHDGYRETFGKKAEKIWCKL